MSDTIDTILGPDRIQNLLPNFSTVALSESIMKEWQANPSLRDKTFICGNGAMYASMDNTVAGVTLYITNQGYNQLFQVVRKQGLPQDETKLTSPTIETIDKLAGKEGVTEINLTNLMYFLGENKQGIKLQSGTMRVAVEVMDFLKGKESFSRKYGSDTTKLYLSIGGEQLFTPEGGARPMLGAKNSRFTVELLHPAAAFKYVIGGKSYAQGLVLGRTKQAYVSILESTSLGDNYYYMAGTGINKAASRSAA